MISNILLVCVTKYLVSLQIITHILIALNLKTYNLLYKYVSLHIYF